MKEIEVSVTMRQSHTMHVYLLVYSCKQQRAEKEETAAAGRDLKRKKKIKT